MPEMAASESTLNGPNGQILGATPATSGKRGDSSERQSRPLEKETEKSYQLISPSNIREGKERPPLGSRARSSRSLRPTRSYGDGHGFVCLPDEKPESDEENSQSNSEDNFTVAFDGEDDPMSPRAMTKFRKWVIVVIISSSSMCVTCTSSLYTSTYTQIEKEFHCSRIVATLGLSLFVMGLGIGPMLLGPLSEASLTKFLCIQQLTKPLQFYGRRPIYVISFAFFLIWIIPCAVAQNIQTMLIARFINGFAGSAFLSVAGGTVGDLFSRTDLQAPMMLYTASPFVGPELGPLIGGFINQNTSWRWSFYVLLIWSGTMLALIVALVPETYHPVVLRKKAETVRKETGDDRYYAPMERNEKSIPQTILWSIIRPFQLLTLEPMCLNLCLFSAVLLGILYLFFGAFALVFETNHDFELYQVGLSFLGLFFGMIAGILTDPFWHRNYQRLVKKREDEGGETGGSEPEYRLPPAILGGILVPIGLFWFGWTTQRSVHWIVPIIGSGVFGMGTLLVFSGVFTFLVDAYPLFAASALAANSFARSTFAAAFPLFGVQMYEKLGYPWATSLLAFLALALAPFPYIFFRYGKRIRGTSRFAKA